MNTAFWNCRGLKGSLVVRRLKGIKKSYSPDILFLVETKNPDDVIRDVGAQLGFDYVKCVSPVGIGGGIALFWNKNVDVTFYTVDGRLIDCKINNIATSFYLSCVYGNPIRSLRHILWEKIERIATSRVGPWLMLGDFNEIRSPDEKIGGVLRQPWSFVDFNNMLSDCHMRDLPFIGNNMTWSNKKKDNLIQCWLDRGFANDEWHALFPESKITYLEMIESDHRPAVIQIRKHSDHGRKCFTFDQRLLENEELRPIIAESWLGYGDDLNTSFTNRIRRCRQYISDWKRLNSTNAAKRIRELTEEIDVGHLDPNVSSDHLKSLQLDLVDAYRQEEEFWYQKSRLQWNTKGDRNTRFYHVTTKNRRARNNITTIKNQQGEDLEGNLEISQEAITYFTNMFSTSGPLRMGNTLHSIHSVITPEMNDNLIKDITAEEVKESLFAI